MLLVFRRFSFRQKGLFALAALFYISRMNKRSTQQVISILRLIDNQLLALEA